MKTGPELLYLDLLKRTLTFSLWPAPPVPVTSPRFKPRLARWLLRPVAAVFRLLNLQIGGRCRVTDGQREEGRAWPEYAHTMIGLKRLDNLQDCIETVLRENVPGDFIETGVWRGGACIFMRAVLAAYGVGDRKVLVADSFNGFPDPDVARYPADGAYGRGDFAFLAVSRQEVEANFRTYGLLDEQVVFLEGWFKDTLPRAPVEWLAVLRIDGDMYESTSQSLEHLYSRLSDGGFCIVDDYALPGCRSAVDAFRSRHGISAALMPIDWTGVYWRKPAGTAPCPAS